MERLAKRPPALGDASVESVPKGYRRKRCRERERDKESAQNVVEWERHRRKLRAASRAGRARAGKLPRRRRRLHRPGRRPPERIVAQGAHRTADAVLVRFLRGVDEIHRVGSAPRRRGPSQNQPEDESDTGERCIYVFPVDSGMKRAGANIGCTWSNPPAADIRVSSEHTVTFCATPPLLGDGAGDWQRQLPPETKVIRRKNTEREYCKILRWLAVRLNRVRDLSTWDDTSGDLDNDDLWVRCGEELDSQIRQTMAQTGVYVVCVDVENRPE